jgi:hypothetical protein
MVNQGSREQQEGGGRDRLEGNFFFKKKEPNYELTRNSCLHYKDRAVFCLDLHKAGAHELWRCKTSLVIRSEALQAFTHISLPL